MADNNPNEEVLRLRSQVAALEQLLEVHETTLLEQSDRLEQAVELQSKRAAELQTVAQVSAVAASLLETSDLLYTVVDLTKSSFNLYHAHIYLLDESRQQLELAAGAGEVGLKMVDEGWQIALDAEQSLVAQAARERLGVIVNDIRETPGFMANPLLPETASEMAVPLIVGENVLGVLDVQSAETDYFTNEDVNIMTSLASQIAVALQNARQFQQTQNALAETEDLYQGSAQLVQASTYDEILEALVQATRLAELDMATLALFETRTPTGDPETILVTGAWSKGDLPDGIIGRHMAHEDTPILQNLSPSQPLIIPDVETADNLSELSIEAIQSVGLRGIVLLPLFVGDQWLGYVTGNSFSVFEWTEEDVRQAMNFAGQAASAIQNQLLYEQTQAALARTDELYSISQGLNDATNEAEILEALVQPAVQNGAIAATLMYLDLDKAGHPEWLEFVAEWLVTGEEPHIPVGTRYNVKEMPLSKLWLSDIENPLLISDFMTDERIDDVSRAVMKQGTVRAFAIIPLTRGREQIGTLIFNWEEPHEFSPQEQETYRAIIGLASPAVQSRRLFEQTQMALARTDELYNISQGLNDAANEAEILEALVPPAKEAGAFNANLIYLDLDATGKPEWAETVGGWQAEGEIPIPIGTRYYLPEMPFSQLWLADPNNPLLVSDLETDTRIDDATRAAMLQGGTHALAVIPLTRGGVQTGLINFSWDQPHKFSPQEIEAYRALIGLASPAVTSRRLFAQTQIALARTDQLYNISQGLNDAADETEILEALVPPAKEANAISADLIYLDLDAAGKPEWAETMAHWRTEGEIPIPLGTRFYLPEMPLSQLWIANPENILLISDTGDDERIDEVARAVIQRGGTRALAVIPLTRGGVQTGLINFSWDQPHEFSPQEIETYRALIGLASPAVTSRRLFAQTQEALEAVQESEAQLGEALDIAKLGYWEFDFINNEFVLTDNFYHIFHTTAEEVGGYRLTPEEYSEKFVYPEDTALVEAEIERGLASTDRHFTGQVEHRFLYHDGGIGYITVNVNLEHDEDGNVTRWYGANQDITERRQAEEEVRQAQARAQTILETVNLPMIISRLSDITVTFANEPAAEIVGMPLDELIGAPSPNFYYNQEERTQIFEALQEQGFVNNREAQLVRQDDGSSFYGLLSARVFDYQGEQSILLTITDITETLKAQEEVRQAQERAQTILETVTLPMIISRLSDNFITFANEPAAEIAGIPLDELVDAPVPNFFYGPEERTRFFEALQEQGLTNNFQAHMVRQDDGSSFYGLLSARFFTYQGEQSILLTITDITERIEAQETIAKRAVELATVADVGTRASTILDDQELIETVVHLTQERFNLYHCHIFLFDENDRSLQVVACGWEADSPHVGTVEQVAISADQEQSLVARAVREQRTVIVNDVQADPDWLPNALLPETRAEMAVPLIAGNQVLGVLDVQANQAGHFTEEDISIMSTLASQVAVSFQNANQFKRTQTALDDLTRLQQSMSREGWQAFMTATERPLEGFLATNKGTSPILRDEEHVSSEDGKAAEKDAMTVAKIKTDASVVITPMNIRGVTIGGLGVRIPPDQKISAEDQEILNSVSEQVALALETARLSEQTQRALAETEDLYQGSAQLVQASTYDEILEALVQATRLKELDIATMVLFETRTPAGDPETLLVTAAWSKMDLPEGIVGRRMPHENTPILQNLKPDQPLIVPDVEVADNLSETSIEAIRSAGMRGMALLPLFVGDQWLGYVTGNSFRVFEWKEEDVRQAMTFVGQAATAIQNQLLFQQTQTRAQREQTLRQITAAVRGSTDPATIMRTAVRELGTALGRRTMIRFAQTAPTTDEGNGNASPE